MGGRPRVDGTVATVAFEVSSAPPVAAARRVLRSGMVVAEVVELLGEPQVVTRGPAGREVWVWDGVSSALLDRDAAPSGPGLLAGAGVTRRDPSSTITVVVRFDELQQVSSISLLAGGR